MKVKLNPLAWNVDGHRLEDGTVVKQGEEIEISKDDYEKGLVDLTVSHFGETLPLFVKV